MWKLLGIFLLITAVTTSPLIQVPIRGSRIAGGLAAQRNQFPYQVIKVYKYLLERLRHKIIVILPTGRFILESSKLTNYLWWFHFVINILFVSSSLLFRFSVWRCFGWSFECNGRHSIV